MSNFRIPRSIAVGTLGIAGIAAGLALPAVRAGAATAPVNITARCSGSSTANLQLQREDTGAVSVDFGVDMARHKAGVQWHVTETDNGTVFVNKSVKTIRDGSFSVTSTRPPAASKTVVGTAVNPSTGESCSISGTV
jgi:hypothetical protein